MLNFENMSRPEMIAARRTIRDNLDTLTAIYKDTCTGNPADLDRMGFYPNIHPAHINQLADAAR